MSTLELTPLSPTQVAHNFAAQLFLLCLSHVKPWANVLNGAPTSVNSLWVSIGKGSPNEVKVVQYLYFAVPGLLRKHQHMTQ